MKKFASLLLAITLMLTLTGCLDEGPQSVKTPQVSEEESIKLAFNAIFYDNYGKPWLTAVGNSFDIKPNKVKEYSYSSDGDWINTWTLSSVVSVDIDGKSIETCGSTVIFADTRLEQMDIDIPEDIDTSEYGVGNSIASPGRWSNYWTLKLMWDTQSMQNKNHGAKVVIIQSQNGDPICMFTGDSVSWRISKDLPKTTILSIDGKAVYIHRANFAIIDKELFE